MNLTSTLEVCASAAQIDLSRLRVKMYVRLDLRQTRGWSKQGTVLALESNCSISESYSVTLVSVFILHITSAHIDWHSF